MKKSTRSSNKKKRTRNNRPTCDFRTLTPYLRLASLLQTYIIVTKQQGADHDVSGCSSVYSDVLPARSNQLQHQTSEPRLFECIGTKATGLRTHGFHDAAPGTRDTLRDSKLHQRNLVEIVEKRSSTHGGRRCNCYGLTLKGQQLLSAYQRTEQTPSITRRAEIYQELRDEHPDRTFSCIALLAATELTDGRASALLATMQINAPALMQQTTRAIEADLLCICGYETSPDGGRERRVALTPDGKRLLYLMLQI